MNETLKAFTLVVGFIVAVTLVIASARFAISSVENASKVKSACIDAIEEPKAQP